MDVIDEKGGRRSAMRPATFAEFRAGAADILPAAIAAAPFGLLFGALAAQKGISTLEVILMGGLVFAGGAQFVSLEIWRQPVPWLLIILSTLLVNSRHLLMGASLAPKIRRFPAGQSLLSLFLMADEVWALAEQRAARQELTFPYYLGLGGALWLNWMVWTGAGAALGAVLADPTRYGFDFAFTALFITLLVGLPRARSTGAAIAASAAAATVVRGAIDGPWYIAAGGVAGAIAGALVGPGRQDKAP